jgi:predicted enzyme related to lactoylglutathione lyase
MVHLGNGAPGQFCWVDLAASDTNVAKAFYGRMFGWTSSEQAANGGSFTRLRRSGQDVGSVYQLSARHRENGVPSHWTPYVRVDDVEAAAQRAVSLGGEVVVRPFVVEGTARIALILDCVGAQVGLWQTIGSSRGEKNVHG